MKCRYCNKELPRLINRSREICECKKAQIEWKLMVRKQMRTKELNQIGKDLSELKVHNSAVL